jgi:hypothetical protein
LSWALYLGVDAAVRALADPDAFVYLARGSAATVALLRFLIGTAKAPAQDQ